MIDAERVAVARHGGLSEAAYSEHRYEHVTEVSAFVYSGRDEMFARACRYFRSDERERLKDIFLAHYRVEDASSLTSASARASGSTASPRS